MLKPACMIDQKPIVGPAYASRDKKGFLCERHRNKEEKAYTDTYEEPPVSRHRDHQYRRGTAR